MPAPGTLIVLPSASRRRVSRRVPLPPAVARAAAVAPTGVPLPLPDALLHTLLDPRLLAWNKGLRIVVVRPRAEAVAVPLAPAPLPAPDMDAGPASDSTLRPWLRSRLCESARNPV